jgi:hypothetical protein
MTVRPQKIYKGGRAVPVLGIDAATNRPADTLASGTSGVGSAGAFTVSGAAWPLNAFKDCWLIDSRYEPYQIVSNSANQLLLLSGQPREGAWRIVQNPTFLEQLVVEFYRGNGATGEGEGEGETGAFSLSRDLLPLDIDQSVSGVAIYRDNDNDPANRNGVFDPDIDIPIQLDDAPVLIGEAGEPETQVKFVFSSPGTDNWPEPIEQQPRLRQWVPETFGERTGDPFQGPDFFVVVRAARNAAADVGFRAAIVSWGPNTPTEPDPDTFTYPPPPAQPVDEFNLFSEFPWGSRALGFITFFKDPPTNYYADGFKAKQEPDSSGFNWIRSTSSKNKRTGLVVTQDRIVGPYSLVIDSVSQSQLPASILSPNGFSFVIYGSGFGESPLVAVSGYDLDVTTSTDTEIDVTIRNRTDVTPYEPVVLVVRNAKTEDEESRDDLFTLTSAYVATAPAISRVTPNHGGQSVFPVTVYGTNFTGAENLEVVFGRTIMPVDKVASDGSWVKVSFPSGGFPSTGPLDVIVRNLEPNSTKSVEDVLVNGFTYENPPRGPCFIATAAYGSPLAERLSVFRSFRDDVLLASAAGTALVELYYSASPPIADMVARYPWVAALVRCVLTPTASALTHPVLALAFLAALAALLGGKAFRRRRKGASFVRARVWRLTLVGLFVGGLVGLCWDAHAFVPYRAFNSYQQFELLKWSMATLNDRNNDGDISGSNEGLEVLVESGANGFTNEELDIVTEAFGVWQDVPTSYIGFQLLGPTADPLPAGDVQDFINTVQIQVPTDSTQVGLGAGVLALTTFTVLVDDGYYPDTGSYPVQAYVSGGQIIEADIIVDGLSHRPAQPGVKAVASLKSTLVHEIGHLIGLGHTPLNNLETAIVGGSEILVESPVVALRDASNVLRLVGATPTMFPIQFFVDDGSADLADGPGDLAPDDIAGVSYLYPRGNQQEFFTISQEARTNTRSGIPSIPIIGGHVVAWCDVDNDPNTPRVPLFSTITGYYKNTTASGGRFDLYGLYKELEGMGGVAAFQATYTFTLNAINETGLDRQAPSGYTPEDFMSPAEATDATGDTTDWGGLTPSAPIFPSEVFHEDGNIFDVAKHDLGTPMVFDRGRNAAISVDSAKTLPTMRPWIEPMFGDPDPVCPYNVIYSSTKSGGTTTIGALRNFRDNVLLETAVGSALVDVHYQAAPAVAAFLVDHARLLSVLRFLAPGVDFAMGHPRTFVLVLVLVLVLVIGFRVQGSGPQYPIVNSQSSIPNRQPPIANLFRLFALILAILSAAPPAFGSIMNLSDEDMVRMSDEIVTGTVQTVEGRWIERDGHRGIVTDIAVLLDDTMKGGVNKNSVIYMTLVGGRVGNTLTLASEMPSFNVGEEVLLYLTQKNDGTYVVVAGARGKFEVYTDTLKAAGSKYLVGSSDPAKVALAVTVAKRAGTANAAESSNGASRASSGAVPAGETAALQQLDEIKIPLDDYKDYIRGIVKSQKK